MKPDHSSRAPLKALGLCALLLFLVLAVLFWRAFLPEYTVFSNDGPLGAMVATQNRLPAIMTGMWMDLNWMGNPYPSPGPMLSTALRFVTTPLFCSKVLCQFSLFVVGLCAWFCFRQYRFSNTTCLLVALATALNSDFFNTAAWGVCSQPVAFGMNFLALAALADPTSPRRWLRVALAGFCVGLGVMEAYDIGALFSLFVAAFVIAQSLAAEGPVVKRLVNGIGRLAVVGVCAGLIAAAALVSLVGTQIKGVAGVGQDAESKAARWNFAVQYSLPKLETLGIVVPGLFGLRHDTPDGGAYWGRGGSDPSWDEFVESGGKRGQPGGAFRAGAGSNYAGVLVVLLAAFALAQSCRKTGGPFSGFERKLIWFWAAVAIAGMVLMWGRFAPFYQFFYALPYASTIRNPAKFHHILQWALLILFAYGAEGLSRVGFQSAAGAATGLQGQWKAFWAKANAFDRKWVFGSVAAVGVFAVSWLLFASMRGQLEQHLVEQTRLQYLAAGAQPEQAVNAAAASLDSARATAKFSVGQAGRGLLYFIPAVALVAVALSGYFRGGRAKVGGALLGVLLVADLLPFNTAWVAMVNWKLTYETNPTIEFLRQRPYEQRVAIFPLDPSRLPREVAGQAATLIQLYGVNWKQWLFQYYDIQSLDIVQEPRVPMDKAAYEAVINSSPLRRWELSNTRYLMGPAGLLDVLNQQFDPVQKSFRIAHQFSLAPKPGTQGQRAEEITTVPGTSGPLAVLEFAGALPRAKLYANWKVSTNEPAKLQEWSKKIQQQVPLEWRSALAAQNDVDLATLHELADKSFDPHQTVLLAEPLPVSPGTNQSAGEVKFESYAPKHIVLRTKATAPSVLLLNDKHDANWRVTVDGQPAELLRCNFIARGVFLDKPGEHRIEFLFQPPLAGLYVSLAAIAVGLGLLGYLAVGGRGKRG